MKKEINGIWGIVLFMIPLLFPLLVVSGIGYGFFPKSALSLIQRDEWASFEFILNTDQSIKGLNVFTYLITNFSILFGLTYFITGIVFCIRRKNLPLIFFAIWIMGTFESHLISFAYGGGLTLLLISNYYDRKPEFV